MDIISQIVTGLRNGVAAKKKSIFLHKTRSTLEILDVLVDEGYITGYAEKVPGKPKFCEVYLKYYKGLAPFREIRQISSPSRRVFITWEEICYFEKTHPMTTLLVSTNKGILPVYHCGIFREGGIVLLYIS